MPPEDIVEATSLSDQALNYVGDLKHKFLVLSEAVHKDVVEHQLREMVSAKQLSRLVTRKDPKTGELATCHVKQQAIVSMVMSTTSRNINPENASRCFVIETDESIEQTKRIHEAQRRKHTLERHHVKLNSVPRVKQKHRTAQRLLKKIFIVNEFGKHLDFPVTLMRTRRDHDRFMDLIAVVCFLRQYQKETKEHEGIEYIECDYTDYEISRRIMVSGVLKATMHDIPKSAIELYNAIRKYCRNEGEKKNLKVTEISFTQRDMREKLGFGHSWIKINLRMLVDYEYIIVTAGGRARQKSFYRLRDDESIEEFNLSMIPTTEKIKELLKMKENE